MTLNIQINNNSNFFTDKAYMRIATEYNSNKINNTTRNYNVTAKMKITGESYIIKLDNFDSMRYIKIIFFDNNLNYEYNFKYKKQFDKDDINITIDNDTNKDYPTVKLNNITPKTSSKYKNPVIDNSASCTLL